MSLSNDRSREASNIHAPATNYGGGMEVFGLRDVSVCHDGPYRHCCLHTRPAASEGGKYGLLAKDVPPVRVPSTETVVVPVSSTSRHRERPLGHCCRAWPFRALAESTFPWPVSLSTFSREGVCRPLQEGVRVKLYPIKLWVFREERLVWTPFSCQTSPTGPKVTGGCQPFLSV
jgi:hypothetical protein